MSIQWLLFFAGGAPPQICVMKQNKTIGSVNLFAFMMRRIVLVSLLLTIITCIVCKLGV